MLIRLHMWEVQMSCKKETESVLCPLCKRKQETTEHVIECGRENEKMYDLKDEHTKEEWLTIRFTGKIRKKREIKPERLEENDKRTEIVVVVAEQQKENKRRQQEQKRREKSRR